MTATTSPPPRDGEVCGATQLTELCQCGHERGRHSDETYHRSHDLFCRCREFRPAPPSEPPAETQQDDEPTREDRAVAMGLVRRARAANSDDEVDAVRDRIAREIATERALASRPSADTETLRADPIEAVAVALWNAEHGFPWSQSITQDYYRSRARAALGVR